MPLESASIERSIFNNFFCSSGCQFRNMAEMAVEGLSDTSNFLDAYHQWCARIEKNCDVSAVHCGNTVVVFLALSWTVTICS